MSMTVKEYAALYEEYVIATRRYLHSHPELGLEEYNTTAFIKSELEKLDIEVQTFPDITGCIGTIRGTQPGKTVMLRADIDALPITEENTCDYCSQTPGVMHACGHDCHTAMLLTAAKILVNKKDEIQGTVKLIFQMAEEVARYADEYVFRGCLKDVDAIFGMHVWNDLPAGTASMEYGERMACADRFVINVYGETAEGAAPQLGKDALTAAAAVIMNLQNITSHGMDPAESLVISPGQMNGGTAGDTLCDHVEIIGTVRAFNLPMRALAEESIKRIAEGTGITYGCRVTCEYSYESDPLINSDPHLVAVAERVTARQMGQEALVHLEKMPLGEDFSSYLVAAPGMYGYLGSRNDEKGINYMHHHPKFDVDESILKDGAAIYADFALSYLGDGGTIPRK